MRKVPRGIGFANRQFVKLRFIDTLKNLVTWDGASKVQPAGVGNAYNINSIYSLQTSGVLPCIIPGREEYARMYGRFRVHAASVKIRVENLVDYPVKVLMHFQNEIHPSSFTTWENVMRFVGNKNTYVSTVSAKGGVDRGFVKGFCKMKYLYGSPKTYAIDLNTAGLTSIGTGGSDPAVQFTMYIWCLSVSGQNVPSGYTVLDTQITLYVEFFDRNDVNV